MRTGLDRTCHYCGREADHFVAGRWLCNVHVPMPAETYTRSDLEAVAAEAIRPLAGEYVNREYLAKTSSEIVTRYLASRTQNKEKDEQSCERANKRGSQMESL